MKNSIKRAQSQARSSFAERENFRPKVKQLKKTLLTLVALLAVTTGAWAQTETLLTTIESTVNKTFKSGNMTFDDKVTVTFSGEVSNDGDNWGWYFNQESGKTITVTAASDAYTITRVKFYSADGSAFDEEAPFEAIVMFEGGYIAKVNGTSIGHWGVNKIEVYGYEGTAEPASSSGPEVAWNKTEKTGTFTMPGGNVTLEPEYYPQAALAAAPTAINDVPATTDGAIVEAGTVANIGSTETAQGTVMYYVSPTALDDAALLALAADQWTADVPTAAHLAQGQAYVYYYVRGNDSDNDDENFSDGDILAANAIQVTLAAEPTYAVTFADDTAEPTLWTADPNADVKKGQTVTVTYAGTKKVIGVKAEKKAAAPAIDYSTAQLGDLFYSDGTFSTTLETGKTPIGVIAYLDKEGTDDDEISEKSNGAGHGLVLCLKNAASAIAWSTEYVSKFSGQEVTSVDGLKRTENVSGYIYTAALTVDEATAAKYPAAAAAKNYTGLTAPAGTTGWFLPSAQQWVKMQTGLGELAESSIKWNSYFDNSHTAADKWEAALSKAGSGNYDSMTSEYIFYWLSSEYSADSAVKVDVDATDTGADYGFSWSFSGKGYADDGDCVRPVLAF